MITVRPHLKDICMEDFSCNCKETSMRFLIWPITIQIGFIWKKKSVICVSCISFLVHDLIEHEKLFY